MRYSLVLLASIMFDVSAQASDECDLVSYLDEAIIVSQVAACRSDVTQLGLISLLSGKSDDAPAHVAYLLHNAAENFANEPLKAVEPFFKEAYAAPRTPKAQRFIKNVSDAIGTLCGVSPEKVTSGNIGFALTYAFLLGKACANGTPQTYDAFEKMFRDFMNVERGERFEEMKSIMCPFIKNEQDTFNRAFALANQRHAEKNAACEKAISENVNESKGDELRGGNGKENSGVTDR